MLSEPLRVFGLFQLKQNVKIKTINKLICRYRGLKIKASMLLDSI